MNMKREALLAILPGVALTQLWELVGNVESVLLGISVLILVSSLLGLNAMLLASMRERRREIEVLRSIGAPSSFILSLLMIESLLIVSVGVVLAMGPAGVNHSGQYDVCRNVWVDDFIANPQPV